ncbi:MAG: hypothetical protein RL211_1982 [Pseudomonadota bacterium]|jgi:hypothetical protein
MIFKELDSFESQNADTLAVHRAQEQMTYYLRRAFGASEGIDALSGLRLSSGDIEVQIDHLVIHPYGMVIVDCQSVLGGLQVRFDGQWLRWRNSQAVEMPSPIERVFAQAAAFKRFLDKKVKQPGFSNRVEIAVLVAVPDKGTIEWPSGGALSVVCNADQVPSRVCAHVQECAGRPDRHGMLSPDPRHRLAEFLRASHKPHGAA